MNFIILIIVVAVILIIVIRRPKNDKETKANKPFKCSVTVSKPGEEPKTTVCDIDLNKMPNINSDKSEKRLLNRERRSDRRKKIWIIFRYMLTLKDLLSSKDFYDYGRNYDRFVEVKKQILSEKPEKCYFNAAFNLCRIKYYKGECQYKLTEHDKQITVEYESYDLNVCEILNHVIKSFEGYWDDVLISYKRPKARINRIEYLIKELNKYQQYDYIRNNQEILPFVQKLKNKYESYLNS